MIDGQLQWCLPCFLLCVASNSPVPIIASTALSCSASASACMHLIGKTEVRAVNSHADGPNGTNLSLVLGIYSWKIRPKTRCILKKWNVFLSGPREIEISPCLDAAVVL